MKHFLQLSLIFFGLTAYSQNPADLDITFGSGGLVSTDFNSLNEHGTAMVIQPDGKIILVGSGIINTADHMDFCIARYHTDGSLDMSFGIDGKANFEITNFENTLKRDYASGVALQSDGKILICGISPKENLSTARNDFTIIRLNTDGSLDTSYATNGILRIEFGAQGSIALAMAMQSDDKAVVVGTMSDGSAADMAIARINTDGTLDNTFSGDGKQTINIGISDQANAIAIQNDGNIILAGSTADLTGNVIALARLLENGTLDPTFGTSGKVVTNLPSLDERLSSVLVQPDGKIIGAGTSFYPGQSFIVVRYNADGSLDPSFGTSGATTVNINTQDIANDAALQSDGKIIVVGSSTDFTIGNLAVVRLTANGSVDSSFSDDGVQLTSMTSATATAVCIQSDSKIVIGGHVGVIANTGDFILARYLGDSALSIDDYSTHKLIQIYPNPAASFIRVKFHQGAVINSEYSIIDINGREITGGTLFSETTGINIENLSKGVYILRIDNQYKKFVKK